MYADKITDSIDAALKETARRREKQQKYNIEHNITPQTIKKSISSTLKAMSETDFVKDDAPKDVDLRNVDKQIKDLTKKMKAAAEELDFENTVKYRDKIKKLEEFRLKNS